MEEAVALVDYLVSCTDSKAINTMNNSISRSLCVSFRLISCSFNTVFNWKEKKLLRLSIKKEKKETKIAESGNWADIAHLFDEKKGDVKVNWDVEKNFVIDAVDESSQQINSRKQVSMSLLFGTEKSFGLLPKKENVDKLKFSHSRVFGHTRKSLYNPSGVLNS